MSHDPQPRFSVMMPPGTADNVHTDDAQYANYVHAHYTKQGVHAVLVDHHANADEINDMVEERAAMEDTYAW
jgi:hypothetical protein